MISWSLMCFELASLGNGGAQVRGNLWVLLCDIMGGFSRIMFSRDEEVDVPEIHF